MIKYHLVIRCGEENIVHPPHSLPWIFAHLRKLVIQGYYWTRTDVNEDDGLIEVRLTDTQAQTVLEMPISQAELFCERT